MCLIIDKKATKEYKALFKTCNSLEFYKNYFVYGDRYRPRVLVSPFLSQHVYRCNDQDWIRSNRWLPILSPFELSTGEVLKGIHVWTSLDVAEKQASYNEITVRVRGNRQDFLAAGDMNNCVFTKIKLANFYQVIEDYRSKVRKWKFYDIP